MGDDSEQARFEHRAQTWATALHGKWLRQSVGVAVAKHTWRGVREVVGSCERRGGGGVGMVGGGGLVRGKGSGEWSEVVRSPARSAACGVQGETWAGGGRDIGGNATRAGDTRGDNATTEHQQDRHSAAEEPGVRRVHGAVRAMGGGAGGAPTGGVQGDGAAKQLRRGGQRQGGNSTKRGVWIDPAAVQLGNIAELDPGAFAFGRL